MRLESGLVIEPLTRHHDRAAFNSGNASLDRYLQLQAGQDVKRRVSRVFICRDPGSSLDQLQAASIAYRIAIGPHAGRKALTFYSVPPLDETPERPQLAQVAGFSLQATTVCEAWQRSRLDRLCRYITRPPVATKRLSVDGQGHVVYRNKQPFRDGSTHVMLEPRILRSG